MPKTYNEENLFIVEGAGLSASQIYDSYMGLLNSGFNMNVQEIADYLDCSYQYVNQYITPRVLHIRINETARSILFRKLEEIESKETYYQLFTKRILFDRQSFIEFILLEAEYLELYKRFYPSDFEPQALNLIEKRLKAFNEKIDNKKRRTLSQHMQSVISSFDQTKFKHEASSKKLSDFPEHLLSQNSISETFHIPYRVSFYRKIEKEGINKLKIGNLVRFLPSEVNEGCLTWMYMDIYKRLKKKHGRDISKIIIERSLEMLEV